MLKVQGDHIAALHHMSIDLSTTSHPLNKTPIRTHHHQTPRMSHSRGSSRLTIIVAATQSMGIGAGGGLPWKLPGEMKYFARGASTIFPSAIRLLGNRG
jgi:hypothetical protein